MYKVDLDELFQGPLDLLLHLIEKMEIDIHNVPIAKLTDSYLEYLNSVDTISLSNAEEYIVMASTLIHIKSKSLLPQLNDKEEKIEEEFYTQLIEYKNYKEACEKFNELLVDRSNFGEKEEQEIDVDVKLMNLSIDKLHKAFKNLLDNKKFEENTHNIIKRKEISLENVKETILETLKQKEVLKFSNIVEDFNTREEVVAFFICILDMIKNNIVECKENKTDFNIKLIV